MITDNLTNAVFFSDLLPKRCPKLYESLREILDDNGIGHRLLSITGEITTDNILAEIFTHFCIGK